MSNPSLISSTYRIIPLVVDALRRTSGWSLTVVLLLFIAYRLFGDYVPGILQGRPMPPRKFVSFLRVDNVAMLGLPTTAIYFLLATLAAPLLVNRVLMSEKPDRGWEFPGGRLEEGEDIIAGLKREVFEETGTQIIRVNLPRAFAIRVAT